MFGQSISLNMRGSDNFKSPFGGFTSMGIFSIMALILVSRISLFVDKKEVNVQKVRNIQPDPEKMILSKENFMFALSIQQFSSNFVENPYFHFEL